MSNSITKHLCSSSFKLDTRIALLILVVFISSVGASLPFTIFTYMFTNPNGSPFSSYSSFVLSAVFASFAIGQVIGGTILGVCSDRYGRKPILLFSTCGAFFGYVLAALSIKYHLLFFLFTARFISGLFESNIILAQSAIADVNQYNHTDKQKFFSWMQAAGTLGFIFGPLIGIVLSNSNINKLFNYATPFYFAAAVTIVLFVLIKLKFSETLTKTSDNKISVKATVFYLNMYDCLRNTKLRYYFVVGFMFFSAIKLYLIFSAIYLTSNWRSSISDIAVFNTAISIAIAIANIFIVPRLLRKGTGEQIFLYSSIMFACAILTAIVSQNIYVFYGMLIFISIAIATGNTNAVVLLTDVSHEKEQAKTLSAFRAMGSMGNAAICLIGGFLTTITDYMPLLVDVILLFTIAILIYAKKWSKRNARL